MKYLSLIPIVSIYIWLTIISIPHFIKGDFYEYAYTAVWGAITVGIVIGLPIICLK